MKRLSFSLLLLTLIIMLILCTKKTQELQCCVDIATLKENIRSITNADTVLIYTKRIKEEFYFSEIRCPIIIIENATTKTLDFKTLPMDKYQRFENFREIENGLKTEGYTFAKQIIGNCDMTDFNDLIIEFFKRDSLGNPRYRFICHYSELLNSHKAQ